MGYALMLAAEITERVGDLDEALVLAERAVRGCQTAEDRDGGYARSVRAGLLLRLGREDEGLAELARLRRLLTRDADAVSYVSEALEAGGRPEIAEQWLTAALETLRQRESTGSREDPAYRRAAMIVYALTQQRHRIRRDLDSPHDELADRMRDAVDGALADEDDDDEGDLAVLASRVEDLARYAARHGGDTTEQYRSHPGEPFGVGSIGNLAAWLAIMNGWV